MMNIKSTLITLVVLSGSLGVAFAQENQNKKQDAEKVLDLNEVTIEERKNVIHTESLPDVQNAYIHAGKKSEVIQLGGVNGNIAEKTGRQIFAKIPGVFVYDMDGSGNQINISTRGLDPHRSWEYNIRQNGVITNSDMYGYPASHYSPAMESIERIELVRGTSSLQYGAQFGGMINYVTKGPDTTKAFSFESINSVGSFGLFSSYNAIGGKVGKLVYSAYYQTRHSNGYRRNAKSDAESQFISLAYEFNRSLRIKAELGRSSYVYQIPGPLTDAMFAADPRQSTRSRNFFNPDIYIPSIVLDWQISPETQLKFTNSGVYGSRNSVMFDAFANVSDTINPATKSYKARQVDIDNFKSFTSELRILHHYDIARFKNVLSGGVQIMHNNLRRRQLGKGTTGSDFDLTLTDPAFGRDLYMKTNNVALFLENMIYLTPRWTVSPGLRYENGATDMTGKISYYDPGNLPNKIKHNFPLFGISSQYRLDPQNRIYGGISQAYRPVVFKDIIPGSVLEKVDKNLKDAYGYNVEAGISGGTKNLRYDIGIFQVLINNRMGTVSMREGANAYILRTVTGDTRTRGVEAYIEYVPLRINTSSTPTELSIFTSTSYFDASYTKGNAVVNGENTSVAGNNVEGVPTWISRNGVQLLYKKLSVTCQYSYVSSNFANPLNTVEPSANGTIGKVPGYGLLDLNATLHINGNYTLRMGVNNITDKQYFTKRPTMYPGAGVWSSDGRSFGLSFGIKI
ncbi:TonB-dependent receptor family protein [Dyadobacter fanqingshengii]|uniref:TonB-dependent receptor n=1 Tax=Dyadobacter fanqingshengii TaxID=2906443 RepID=A0A9X1PDC4_9BACT|nr:TonB-dependent receptor [Dyadobacter fanqingshengii]MCF0043074.1 TonB-dependent receptor [Dyadobacter fanqingshengii]USJ35627.1 TonB-dependent receptor [Dyadobacter fanqingshengii]